MSTRVHGRVDGGGESEGSEAVVASEHRQRVGVAGPGADLGPCTLHRAIWPKAPVSTGAGERVDCVDGWVDSVERLVGMGATVASRV